MARTLVMAATNGSGEVHVTDGADVDVLDFNTFLEDDSEYGLDYAPEDYVNYIDRLATTLVDRSPAWSDADRNAAQERLAAAVDSIRRGFGADLADDLTGKKHKRARKLGLIP